MSPEEFVAAIADAEPEAAGELLAAHATFIKDNALPIGDLLLRRISTDPFSSPTLLLTLPIVVTAAFAADDGLGACALARQASSVLSETDPTVRRLVVHALLALSLDEDDPAPPEARRVLAEQAEALARTLGDSSTEASPDLFAALFAQGRALEELEQHEDAVSPLRQAVGVGRQLATHDSDYRSAVGEALIWLGGALDFLNRQSEMVRAFEEAERFGAPNAFTSLGKLPPWHLLFRVHLAHPDESYLNRATEAASEDSGIVALLEAYRQEDITTVTSLVTELMPRLQDAGRMEEYHTVHLLFVSLPVEQLRYLEEYQASEYLQLLDLQLDACNRAIGVSRRLNDRPCLGKYLFYRASVHGHRHALYLQGTTDTAAADALEASRIYEELAEWDPAYRPALVNIRGNLALLTYDPDRAGAEELLEDAITLCREVANEDPAYWRVLAEILTNLAYMRGHRDSFVEALPPLEEARTLFLRHGVEEHAFQESALTTLIDLAATLFVVDRDVEARARSEDALVIYRRLSEGRAVYRPIIGSNLLTLHGHLLKRANQLEAAREALAEAIDLTEGYLIALSDVASQERLLSRPLNPYEQMVETCLLLADTATAGETRRRFEQEAWAYAERSRARLTAEFIQRVANSTEGIHAPDERQSLLAELAAERRELLTLSEAAYRATAQATGDLPTPLREWLITQTMQRQAADAVTSRVSDLRQRLERLDPALAALTQVSAPDVAEVQRLLRAVPDGATLLEFYPLEDKLAIFVLDGESFWAETVDVPRAHLLEYTQHFRRYLESSLGFDPRDPTQARDFQQALAEGLTWLGDHLQPIVNRYLTGNEREEHHVPHLLMVPAGALHFWPLWALPIVRTGKQLGDRYACSVLPSADTLVSLERYKPKLQADSPLSSFAPRTKGLFFTVPLAHLAASVFGGQAYVGESATFEALRRIKGGIVNLATHAEVLLDTPELSWVQLATLDGGVERIGALEFLIGLDRLRSPLLTILACEVHGARPEAADNWVGLSRAFLRPGRSLITSLWPIWEAATLALTVPLWDALRDGATVPQALRRAVRALRSADSGALRQWGERIAAAVPEEERTAFEASWSGLFALARDFAIAPPFAGLMIWAPYLAAGWPGPLPQDLRPSGGDPIHSSSPTWREAGSLGNVQETIALHLISTRHNADDIRQALALEDNEEIVRGMEAQIEWQRQALMRRQLAQVQPSVVHAVLRTATHLMRRPPESTDSPDSMSDTIFNNAAELIVECGDEGAESLLDALGDADASVQALGTIFLGALVDAPSAPMLKAVAFLLEEAIQRESHLTIGAAAATIVFWEKFMSDEPIELARFLLADFAQRSISANPHLAPIHAQSVRETSRGYADATLFLRRFPMLMSA